MEPNTAEPESTQELTPLNVIRVETVLSRCPVHRLAKQGSAPINIREVGSNGEVVIRWEVAPNRTYGEPGPLAYRLDTLIVNRRIEEAQRPIPPLIKLGSLHDICRELNLRGGQSRENVKRALTQNAFAGITAKLKYKLANGKDEELDARFTRYSVVFTGEKLPSGQRADAVYLVLDSVFLQVLNGAVVRPLDYDYLKELPPASQRLYELLSYHVYGALRHKRRNARFTYSEFCTYAPLTRFLKWDQVRPQMARIHKPHLKSGYIESVEFEQSVDQAGNPDWVMVYVPGQKARAEFRGFALKGEPRTIQIESPAPLLDKLEEANPLQQELIAHGVEPSTAAVLVREDSEQVAKHLEHLEWRKKKGKPPEDPAAYLVAGIRKKTPLSAGFESKADQMRRLEAQQLERQREAEADRVKRVQERERREDDQRRKKLVAEYLQSLSTDELATFEKAALEDLVPEHRDTYDKSIRTVKATILRLAKEAFARKKLGFPADESD